MGGGYTVAKYRDDRLIGENVQIVIDAILRLDTMYPNYQKDLEDFYYKGNITVKTIYSNKYETEIRTKLDEAYLSKVALIPIIPIDGMIVQVP